VNPLFADWGYVPPKGELVEDGFTYRSDNNSKWLTESDIKEFLAEYMYL
jgi:hypothetical protein